MSVTSREKPVRWAKGTERRERKTVCARERASKKERARERERERAIDRVIERAVDRRQQRARKQGGRLVKQRVGGGK